MHKCKTCAHWKVDNKGALNADDIQAPVDPDTFEPMQMPFEVRRCTTDNIMYFERNPNPNGISVTDASNYFVAIFTGEEFGCVLHSAYDSKEESFIKEFGEQYRSLIVSALQTLAVNKIKWGVKHDFCEREYIRNLIYFAEKAKP